MCKQVFRSAKAMYSHSRVHKASGTQPAPEDEQEQESANQLFKSKEVNSKLLSFPVSNMKEGGAKTMAEPAANGKETNPNGLEASEVIDRHAAIVENGVPLDLTNKGDNMVEADMTSDSSIYDPYEFDGDVSS